MTGVLSLERALEIVGARAAGCRFEIEIGCGNGHFLTEYARELGDAVLLGVDLKPERCEKAARKAARLGLSRVLIVCARAESLIEALAPAVVDAFHIYFPDPWPKSRHRRRRFLRMPQLDELHRRLKPGGRFYFATDFFDYYLQAKLLLLAHGGFALEESTPPPQAFLSVFGQKFADWGRRFHAVVARRLATSAGASGGAGAAPHSPRRSS
jgi:tRNA (guanine-N7-)-methyltransferase